MSRYPNRSPLRMRVSLALIGAISAIGWVSSAAPALAGVEHYCENANLPAWSACAHGNAHGYMVLYTDIQTNHSGCAGVGSGFGGPGPISSFTPTGCTTGAGTAGGSIYPNYMAHGAVGNYNSATSDWIYEAHISW